jgi:hypothetical protein
MFVALKNLTWQYAKSDMAARELKAPLSRANPLPQAFSEKELKRIEPRLD